MSFGSLISFNSGSFPGSPTEPRLPGRGVVEFSPGVVDRESFIFKFKISVICKKFHHTCPGCSWMSFGSFISFNSGSFPESFPTRSSTDPLLPGRGVVEFSPGVVERELFPPSVLPSSPPSSPSPSPLSPESSFSWAFRPENK